MADFLATQVRLGNITLDQIPEKYLEAVKIILARYE